MPAEPPKKIKPENLNAEKQTPQPNTETQRESPQCPTIPCYVLTPWAASLRKWKGSAMSRLRSAAKLVQDVLLGFTVGFAVSLILATALPGETSPDGTTSNSWALFPGLALAVVLVVCRRRRRWLRVVWKREWRRTVRSQQRYEAAIVDSTSWMSGSLAQWLPGVFAPLSSVQNEDSIRKVAPPAQVQSSETDTPVDPDPRQSQARFPTVSALLHDQQVCTPEPERPKPLVNWQEMLKRQVLELHPGAFEHLTCDLLTASGLTAVEVTGGAGDGGIDGIGYRLALLDSFPVYFQCKRYQGSVNPSQVRDFRGAMDGRAGHGILVTTGSFSSAAREESERPGAKSIELIDGDALTMLMRQLQLGVVLDDEGDRVVAIDGAYFDQFEASQ